MLVRDILKRKRYFDQKLEDLEYYTEALKDLKVSGKAKLYNEAVEKQFAVASKIRSHVTLLERLNNETLITIGGNEVSVSDAVKLRDSMKYQMSVLSSIIANGDFSALNIFSLMEQRDSLFDELMMLDSAIYVSDCVTDWDHESED